METRGQPKATSKQRESKAEENAAERVLWEKEKPKSWDCSLRDALMVPIQ